MYCFDRSVPPQSEFLDGSRVLTRGPSLIVGISVCGGGADAAVNVYDGDSDKGKRKIAVYAANKSTESPKIQDGIKCEQGIYVALNATTDLTTVLFYVGTEVKELPAEGKAP